MVLSEAVDVDGEGVLEAESLGLIMASDGETLVRESIGAVLFALLEPAFGRDGGGRGSRKDGGGESELDVMKAGLVADAMGYGVVNLGVSAGDDGGTTLDVVAKEIVHVVFGVEGGGKDCVDVVQDTLEGLSDALGLNVSVGLCESEGVGMVSVCTVAIVRAGGKQGIDLGEVGKGTGLGEGARDPSADSEPIGVEDGTFMTIFHPVKMDGNAVWIGGRKVIEISMEAMEVATREVLPLLNLPEPMGKRKEKKRKEKRKKERKKDMGHAGRDGGYQVREGEG